MKRRWLQRSTLLLADMVLLEAAFFAVYWWRFQTGMFRNAVPFEMYEVVLPSLVISGYWLLLFSWFGLYRFEPLQSRLQAAQAAIKASAVGSLMLFIVTFNPSDPLPRSRVILATYGIAIFIISSGTRVGLLTVLRNLRIRGIGTWKTLLIGGGRRAAELYLHARRHPELGLDVQAAVNTVRQISVEDTGLPVSPLSQLRRLMLTERYEAVLIGLEDSQHRELFRVVRLLREQRVRAFIRADQYPVLVGQVRPVRVYGHPLMDIRSELLGPFERLLKRLTDLAVAVVLIAVTFPLWILLSVLILLDSRGPVLYTQRRVGMDGRIFTMLKFRSMYRNAEQMTGPVLARRHDPRVTRVGRLMRATRLDELPQLVNVLRGQMSLVGPRPERIEFVQQLTREIPLYERRLNVKPGITGWSQVHLKYDISADQVPLKLQYDFWYIENMSLPLDLKILFMTLFVMLRGEGQ